MQKMSLTLQPRVRHSAAALDLYLPDPKNGPKKGAQRSQSEAWDFSTVGCTYEGLANFYLPTWGESVIPKRVKR